jgi:hypothetical protein
MHSAAAGGVDAARAAAKALAEGPGALLGRGGVCSNGSRGGVVSPPPASPAALAGRAGAGVGVGVRALAGTGIATAAVGAALPGRSGGCGGSRPSSGSPPPPIGAPPRGVSASQPTLQRGVSPSPARLERGE